jgi:hypothetical protein
LGEEGREVVHVQAFLPPFEDDGLEPGKKGVGGEGGELLGGEREGGVGGGRGRGGGEGGVEGEGEEEEEEEKVPGGGVGREAVEGRREREDEGRREGVRGREGRREKCREGGREGGRGSQTSKHAPLHPLLIPIHQHLQQRQGRGDRRQNIPS